MKTKEELAAIEIADAKNKELKEALKYALQTIRFLSESKPIRDLDERIAYFDGLIK